MEISVSIVENLIKSQFPQWGNLQIKPVEKSGHDNRTFHLGDKMTVRLPSAEAYVPQVEKEFKWLPLLQKNIKLPISAPIAMGSPNDDYPFPWTVNHYIKGETVNHSNIASPDNFAADLSAFLRELQAIDTTEAPPAGKHNFFRGGDLSVYNNETILSLKNLKDVLPVERLNRIWECAISSNWKKSPVWLHGDVAPGNLLVSVGHLCGVIDFGIMGIGDPACDYAMAWTFFDSKSRNLLLDGLDIDTVNRAKGWALWKALITFESDASSSKTILEILDDSQTL